jgi:hypothetical protein
MNYFNAESNLAGNAGLVIGRTPAAQSKWRRTYGVKSLKGYGKDGKRRVFSVFRQLESTLRLQGLNWFHVHDRPSPTAKPEAPLGMEAREEKR